MADLSKATPRPWCYSHNGTCWQIDGESDAVVTTQFCYAPNPEANAALIVQAVNEREELLAALRIIAGGDGDAQIIARQTLIKVGDKG